MSGTGDPSTAAHSEHGVAVTVVLPVYREVEHVERALRSLLANRTAVGVEILVVDGMSDDGTRDVVERLARADPRVQLLENPARTVPRAMNLGIARARGEVLIRLDGHAEVADDFIACCLEELAAHPECACVGGRIDHVDQTPTSAAISSAMSSPFGVGNAAFRLAGQARPGYVDTVAFGAYRRRAIEQVGGFDESLSRNEDDELNFRLIQAGQQIWLSERIRARYFVRSSLRKLFGQYRQYGYWKVYVNRKHRVITTWRQLVPPAFVASLVLLALLAPFARAFAVLLAVVACAWACAATGFALRASSGPRDVLDTIGAFGTMHVAYGLGYLEGVWDFLIRGRRPRRTHMRLTR